MASGRANTRLRFNGRTRHRLTGAIHSPARLRDHVRLLPPYPITPTGALCTAPESLLFPSLPFISEFVVIIANRFPFVNIYFFGTDKKCKLGFIAHPVGRGILDAPVNLRSKLTLPTAIIEMISFGNWKKRNIFSAARQGCRALRTAEIGTINENLKYTNKNAAERSAAFLCRFFD